MKFPFRTLLLIGLLLVYAVLTFFIVGVVQKCDNGNKALPYNHIHFAADDNDEAKEGEESKEFIKFGKDQQLRQQHDPVNERSYGSIDKPFVHTYGTIPPVIYVVWCGRRWFEFNHYMSLLSAIRILHPDKIYFYYDFLPILDQWIYNTWFDELRDEFPFFHFIEVKATDGICVGHSKVDLAFIRHKMMYVQGGVYINEHTIIDQFPRSLWDYDTVDALDDNTGHGFFAIKGGIAAKTNEEMSAQKGKQLKRKQIRCATTTYYNAALKRPFCVDVPKVFFPKDIWELNEPFGNLTRRIFYGSSIIRKPFKSSDNLIPNIAHVVWIGGGDMDFLFYLCVLSLLHVAKVEAVYIYGDLPPKGFYWDSVKSESRLHYVYRDASKNVFGTKVDVVSHVTDIWRVDFMTKYGGIYVDTDTIFVRPLDDEIRQYDAVGSYDWTYWNHPFPDTINFGVAIGKQGALFWREFQKSMKWFIDSDWSWNGLRQPYRIKERNPEYVFINPRLQVIYGICICFNSLVSKLPFPYS